MCIAIIKPRGVKIAEDVLENCFLNNPDGAGFFVPRQGITKGLMTFDDFVKAYRGKHVDKGAALIHFRIVTKGDASKRNTHPHALRNGAMVHNGTISSLGVVGKGQSDSALLAKKWYDRDISMLKRKRRKIERWLSWNKVAIMDNDENVFASGREDWIKHNGALFSNDTFEDYGAEYSSWWDKYLTRFNTEKPKKPEKSKETQGEYRHIDYYLKDFSPPTYSRYDAYGRKVPY